MARRPRAISSCGEGFYEKGVKGKAGKAKKGGGEYGGPEGDARDEVKGSKGKRGRRGKGVSDSGKKGGKKADQFWKAGFQRSSGDKRTEVMLSRGRRLSEIGRFLNSSKMCRLRRFIKRTIARTFQGSSSS